MRAPRALHVLTHSFPPRRSSDLLLVLTPHPAEVGVCVRLAVEHLIDEALLVVALDVPGPPSETAFVADAGRRERAESFSAGAARTVTRKDLDMIRLQIGRAHV